MPDKTELKKLQSADIEACDKNSLTDISNINIEADQQTVDMINLFVEHAGNPY